MNEKQTVLKINEKIITSISFKKERLEMLDLLSLYNDSTRSAMISKLVSTQSDEEKFIKTIAERIVANYNKKNLDFDEFIKAAIIWLKQKKIAQYHIEKIIEEAKLIHATA